MPTSYNKSVMSRFCIRIVNRLENEGEALSLPQRSVFWRESQNWVSYLENLDNLEVFCRRIFIELRKEDYNLTEFQEGVFLDEAKKAVNGLRELFNVRNDAAASDRYPARISRLDGYAASN